MEHFGAPIKRTAFVSRVTLELFRNNMYRRTLDLDIPFGDHPNISDSFWYRIDRCLHNLLCSDCQDANLDILVPIHQFISRNNLISGKNTGLKQPEQH